MAKITASTVAKYLLLLQDEDAGDLISNLKLQKLLYYAQGLHLAKTGKPLFAERICAWTHGPVVPDVYHEYKGFGGDAIPLPKDFDVESIPENVRGFLNEIYRLLAQFSAWKLRDMTHGTAPYLKAEARKGEISTESMFDYFSTWLKK
jgi:uncharacterized phage-associated protein